MLEEGIVQLVNIGLGAPSPIGGYLDVLPKNPTYPSWTYSVSSFVAQNGLLTPKGLAFLRLQVDVYGAEAVQGADVLTIAQQIDVILNGYKGTLSDPDSTYVDSCFTSDKKDFPFDPDARTYRRMLEYTIWYRRQ